MGHESSIIKAVIILLILVLGCTKHRKMENDQFGCHWTAELGCFVNISATKVCNCYRAWWRRRFVQDSPHQIMLSLAYSGRGNVVQAHNEHWTLPHESEMTAAFGPQQKLTVTMLRNLSLIWKKGRGRKCRCTGSERTRPHLPEFRSWENPARPPWSTSQHAFHNSSNLDRWKDAPTGSGVHNTEPNRRS